MRREDLFEAIGMVDEELLARCDAHRNSAADAPMEDRKMRTYTVSSDFSGDERNGSKLRRLAAWVAVFALLAGGITAIRYMIGKARHNDTAQTDVSQLRLEHVQLTADEVTSMSMRLCFAIDRDQVDMDYVPIQTAAPYTIEMQTETGWEQLEPKTDVWSKDRKPVMVWDQHEWFVNW